MKNNKDIARIDQESKRTYGWYARVNWRGIQHRRFFSDKKLGGKNSALLAAIAWRDSTYVRIGKPWSNLHQISVASNSTGVVGVRLNEKLNRFEVSWVNQVGKQGKTSVSIQKYGRRKAFERARAIRREKEAARLSA
jgi:hypothetical protein